ncbi:MAG TPA: hypothetical protein EYP53_02340 [Candidatus Latescibacteria bacterium]|nr:hypothetical protein [Candidatus Latescibacterota bacterium]
MRHLTRFVILFTFLVVLFALGCQEKSPTGLTIEQRLIGLWRRSWTSDTTYVSLTRFETENRFVREIHRGDEEGEIVWWATGHFFVVGNVLYTIFDDSSDPEDIGMAFMYEIAVKNDKIYLIPLEGRASIWEEVEES